MPNPAITELLRGKGAHVDPFACVEDISCEVAARTIEGFPHSIGQLVFHMNYWMDYELRRIRGERPRYPEHSAESFPARPSPHDAADWDALKTHFVRLLADYASLADSSPREMRRQIDSARQEDTKRSGTLEAVCWQMVAHNSYHTGQIVTLRQALGVWPPPGGGDSW
jgi:uncharacterized damage-inducible protein DinB